MMENFTVINIEGERLLRESDTSSLKAFMDSHDTYILDGEDIRTPEQIRGYFSEAIRRAIAPKQMKEIAANHLESYLRGHAMIEEILWEDFPELDECRPSIYDALGVPHSSFDLRHALPEIMTRLLQHNMGIVDLFLVEYPQETRIRITEAFIANKFHPFGIDQNQDFSWRSDRGIYIVGQNIHGDVHLGFHEKAIRGNQTEIFSLPSTDEMEGEKSEWLNIYQYTDSFLAIICRYCLHAGYVPEELKNWKKIMENTKSVIPNAATANPMDTPPEHIASLNGWGNSPMNVDLTGEYLYLGNTVCSKPPDLYVTALLHGDSLIFAREDKNGTIVFPGPRGEKTCFRKTFELQQSDIGPALRAIYHLPGRSFVDNRTVLSAYDWARNNGYTGKS